MRSPSPDPADRWRSSNAGWEPVAHGMRTGNDDADRLADGEPERRIIDTQPDTPYLVARHL